MAQTKNIRPAKNKTNGDKSQICKECSAICCRDLTMMITKPRTRDEIEDLKWQLRMDTVNVFVRKYKWHLLFKGNCIYLSRNNLCTIYDKRPGRCRRHDPSECERNGKFYDTLISTPEELEVHLNG